MRKSLITSSMLCLFLISLKAQNDSVSIIQCFREARENATLKPQLELVSEISALKIENTKATGLPALSAFGKASYQSDAVSVNLPIPGTPGVGIDVNRFQYNVGLEADQKLYDGGIAGRTRQLEAAFVESDKNQVESDLYQLNERVTSYFFASLLFENSRKAIILKQELLKKRLEEMGSGVKNGVIKSSECDKISAELLSTKQQLIELDKNRAQMLSALKVLTGKNLPDSAHFFVPDSLSIMPNAIRPEIRYFDSESDKLEKTIHLKSAQNLPKLYAFGQLGYSYPGLNMFKNNSDYFYIVGAKLSWTILDWNQVKRENRMLLKQEEIIKTRRDDFSRNLDISSQKEQIEQEKLLKTIEMDYQIIDKRAAISAASASSLANGVITSSEYLEDLNNEIKARLDLENHKIQYQNSIVNGYLLKGIDSGKF